MSLRKRTLTALPLIGILFVVVQYAPDWVFFLFGQAFIVAALVLVGFGFALFSSPNTNAIMGAVGKKHYGVAASTLGTMRIVGQMLSMGIATLVFSIFIGKARITPDNFLLFLASVKVSFVIFFVLCVCGVFFSLARGRMH